MRWRCCDSSAVNGDAEEELNSVVEFLVSVMSLSLSLKTASGQRVVVAFKSSSRKLSSPIVPILPPVPSVESLELLEKMGDSGEDVVVEEEFECSDAGDVDDEEDEDEQMGDNEVLLEFCVVVVVTVAAAASLSVVDIALIFGGDSSSFCCVSLSCSSVCAAGCDISSCCVGIWAIVFVLSTSFV